MSEIESLTIKVQVVKARGLMAKDRNLMGRRTSSDPYATVNLRVQDNHRQSVRMGKTKTVMKSLDPVWNASFEYTIRDRSQVAQILRSRRTIPLEIHLFDYDQLSDDDNLGTVVIPVDPLQRDQQQQPYDDEERRARWYPLEKGSGEFHCHNAKGQLMVGVSVSARKVLSLVRGNNHPMRHNRIQVGLSWDVLPNNREVDLDASCVALDKNGNILLNETVYYGNLSNSNRSIVHSGDEREGDEVGDDEIIYCQLDRFPPNILALYFILTVATPQTTFGMVQSARVRIRNTDTREPICSFVPHELGQNDTAMFLCRLARSDLVRSDGFANALSPGSSTPTWVLTPIEDTDSHARDFGALLPEIKSYSRDLVPHIRVDPTERMAILRKGGNIRVRDFCTVPSTSGKRGGEIPPLLTMGLAWDVTNGRNIDLDASVICLDEQLHLVEIVFFKQLVSSDGAIRHSGDEREGDEVGDDEKINLQLANVDRRIHYLGITINSYSGEELDDVAMASCHLFDPTSPHQQEIAKYTLSNAAEVNGYTALVMGCLYRGGSGNCHDWNFRVLAKAAQGRTAHDNVDELQWALRNTPVPPLYEPPTEPDIVIDNSMPPNVPHDEEEIVVVPTSQLQEPEIRL